CRRISSSLAEIGWTSEMNGLTVHVVGSAIVPRAPFPDGCARRERPCRRCDERYRSTRRPGQGTEVPSPAGLTSPSASSATRTRSRRGPYWRSDHQEGDVAPGLHGGGGAAARRAAR